MKYLIVGLGNIGAEYKNTRHNIGFKIIDAFAEKHGVNFLSDRYADVAQTKFRGNPLVLIKPSTYMNLSGKAVAYWQKQEKIPLENILVLVDDIALPFAAIRLRANGSEAGHNGLKSISECLQTQNYARLRFGLGNNYPKGGQVDFVLGQWSDEEQKTIAEKLEITTNAIESFVQNGIQRTMNMFNGK